jgi:hypothetical protein
MGQNSDPNPDLITTNTNTPENLNRHSRRKYAGKLDDLDFKPRRLQLDFITEEERRKYKPAVRLAESISEEEIE